MNPPKTFGVWGNIEKDNFWSILPEIIEWSKNNNLELFLLKKYYPMLEQVFMLSQRLIRKIR